MSFAEKISKTQLSVPLYYGMEEDKIDYVVDMLNAY